MPITVSGTSITFNDATVQTTAAAGGFSGATTNAISSSPITLTNTSSQYQVAQISSFTNSYVTLPNATTMASAGSNPFVIENRSPYGANLEIRNAAGTIVGYIGIAQIGLIQLKDKSTSAGQWAVELVTPQTFLTYDANSVASATNIPTNNTEVSTSGNIYGIVGLTSTTFVRWWAVSTGSGFNLLMYTQVGTISGSTISFGAIQNTTIISSMGTSGAGAACIHAIRLSDTAYAVMAKAANFTSGGCCVAPTYYGRSAIAVHTVSGTTVTFGTPSSASMPQYGGGPVVPNQTTGVLLNGVLTRISDTAFAIFYNSSLSVTYTPPYNFAGSMSCQIVSVSGTTMTIGTAATLGTSTYTQAISAVALSATSLALCYAQATATGGSVGRSKLVIISVSGTAATFNTPVTCETADVTCFTSSFPFDAAVAPSATQFIFSTAYSVGEATVSGTVPTFNTFPLGSTPRWPMYLCTSSKVLVAGGAGGPYGSAYLTVSATGGFIYQVPTQVLQSNLSITSAAPTAVLGAQPTTAFVAYRFIAGVGSSAPTFGNANSTLILGNTT